MVVIDEDDYLAHYGTPRHSGRYPWGSGGNVDNTKRNKDFLDIVADLKKQGLTDKQVYDGMGITSTQFRARKSIAKNQQKQAQIARAQGLKDKGFSNVAGAREMGIPESSFRALTAEGVKDKAAILTQTSDMLKKEVAAKTFIDIGAGVEHHLKISKEKLRNAVHILQEEGYQVHNVNVPQIGTGLDTRVKVLTPPGTTWGEVRKNMDKIQLIGRSSEDGGHTYSKHHDPISINPNRVGITYKEDGGSKADGVIFVRPGVADVAIGKARYAQVRIQVGDGHYLKGMAMYKHDLPQGVDLMFNTNKSSTGNKFDAMKPLTGDKELPFGSIVHQVLADVGTPNEHVTSVMNIVGNKPGSGEEGDWATWSKNLSSQFLSKQSPTLAKQQLAMTFERRKSELSEINALTNPTIKKNLLKSFADDTDSAAVHLEAAALSRRQAWHVILPVNSLPPNQIYAPNFNDGERVAVVRYPHGGTFEIPDLIVNNKHPEAKALLGDSVDVVGIHHTVAEHLSGADFDGDTVMVIPNGSGKVKISPALEGLKGFDPKAEYPKYEGMKVMTSHVKGIEMGNVSNLITDMTIRQAPHSDIVRAVRHSMVVIDAEKHELNWRLSAERNGIAQLKREYQGKANAGASTLISKATSDLHVPHRKERPARLGGPVDRVTGEKRFIPTERKTVNKAGVVKDKTFRSTKLAETTDAHTLSSGTPMERVYADHSNSLKALANQARLEALNTPPLRYSSSAKKTYASEVQSLNAKLVIAQRNAPLERQAQLLANATSRAKKLSHPNLEPDAIKKMQYQALADARIRTGAGKTRVVIEPNEWNAIQAGAISDHKLQDILANTNKEDVRKLATPRLDVLMTPAKTSRAASMKALGYTRAEIADQLGVSLSTLDRSLAGD